MLFSGALIVLGLGYIFALLYVYTAHSGRDGRPGLSVEDIIITYSGSAETTRLESALQGPMSSMLGENDLVSLLTWIRAGAMQAGYDSQAKSIIEENCLSCHDGSNPHLSNLDGFDNVRLVTERDTGADLYTLVRVSHIHLFGLSFIFFIMGSIFSHAYLRPVWFKCTVIFVPFVCIALDVSSWYFTKLFAPFAWMVLVAGAFMGLSFAFMWLVSMYQMWLYKAPPELLGRVIDSS